jgi:hypothetical protein
MFFQRTVSCYHHLNECKLHLLFFYLLQSSHGREKPELFGYDAA